MRKMFIEASADLRSIMNSKRLVAKHREMEITLIWALIERYKKVGRKNCFCNQSELVYRLHARNTPILRKTSIRIEMIYSEEKN